MAELHKRSDGFSELENGSLAVFMLKGREIDAKGNKSFSFKPSIVGESITVQWSGEVAVFDADTSKALVNLGHARKLDQDEVDFFNLEQKETGKEPVEAPKQDASKPKPKKDAKDA